MHMRKNWCRTCTKRSRTRRGEYNEKQAMWCVRSGEKGTVVQEDGEAGQHHQVSVMRHANLKK
ncbi:unnamed protein product [Ectocarpus sp. 13 AM-2016]